MQISILHVAQSEGLVTNIKKTYRIYRGEGLQVRTKKRKKPRGRLLPMAVPTAINERWSLDFVSDQPANGRRFKDTQRHRRLLARMHQAHLSTFQSPASG